MRHWAGSWSADGRSGRRLNHATLGADAALATALRSGRAARRQQLQRLNEEKLTQALPLWVGRSPTSTTSFRRCRACSTW